MIFILTSLINLSIGEQELFPFFVWDSGCIPGTIFQVINEPCNVLACDHQPLPLLHFSLGEGLNARAGSRLPLNEEQAAIFRWKHPKFFYFSHKAKVCVSSCMGGSWRNLRSRGIHKLRDFWQSGAITGHTVWLAGLNLCSKCQPRVAFRVSSAKRKHEK